MKVFTKILSLLFLWMMIGWTSVTTAQTHYPIDAPFNKDQALTADQIKAGKKIALWVLNNSVQDRWFSYTDNDNRRSKILSPETTFIVEDADNGGGGIVLKRESDGLYMQKNNRIQWTSQKSDAVVLTVNKPESTNTAFYNDNYLNEAPTWDPDYQNYPVRFTEMNTNNILNGNNETGFATGTGSWSAYLVRDMDAGFNYPFKLSDTPQNDNFGDNTIWYYLKLHGKYAYYSEGNAYVLLSTNKTIDLYHLWAFVEDNGKLKIYNAITGASRVLASAPNPSTSSATYPTLEKESSQDITTTWTYAAEGYGDPIKFCLSLGEEKNKYLNDYADNNKMAFWTGTGDGSQLVAEVVSSEDLQTAIANTKTTIAEAQAAITGAVGTLNPEAYQQFLTYLNQNTVNGIAQALILKENSNQVIKFDSNKYYRLITPGRTANNYMTINDTTAVGQDLSDTNASQIWKFTGDEENGYKLSAQGHYMNTPAKSKSVRNTTEAGNGASFTISESGKTGLYYLDGNGSDQYDKIHLDQYNKIVGWEESDASKWYLIEATSVDVTISDAGYATVNYPFAVQLPSTLTAYTGEPNTEKSKFMLEEVPNGAVPANTPVVIAGPQGTYPLTIDYNNAKEPVIKGLTGVLLPTVINPDDYILAKGPDGAVGFYMTTDGGTLAQNKAYIKTTQTLHGVRGFIFTTEDDENTTTGIESTVAETENEEYYDLQGRRVMNPTKGIYVTKSGKKVLFTK